MYPKHTIRTVLRRLVPYSIKAWYRTRRNRPKRNNVTVLVDGQNHLARWIRATPDTYRIGLQSLGAGTEPFDLIAGDTGTHPVMTHGPDTELMRQAIRALTVTDSDLSVVGPTNRPPLFGTGRFEPIVVPIAVAASRAMFEEIGGAPDGIDLTGLYLRARDAGARLTLVPLAFQSDLKPRRNDPIRGPAVVVLSGVPMHDVGGGSRGAQLARELVRAGCHVTYVSIFPSYESVDLGLRFVHPRLEQYRVDEFDPIVLADRARAGGWMLVEIPAPQVAQSVDELRFRGWRLCYDVIDRWSDPALGGEWYRSSFEAGLLASADLVTATAPDLVDHASEAGVAPTLIPNAVDSDLFGRRPGPLPSDLPPGTGPVIGYHGSLYGEWIDWPAIGAVAESIPEGRVVMIGDASRGHPALPPNVFFLGPKDQAELTDYISRFQVGLVPFVVSVTTHAVSPLKVFEYLACGVPVAAPPLRALHALDGVYTSGSLPEAVEHALDAPPPDSARVLAEHGWANRVADLMRSMGLAPQARDGETPVRRVVRPVRHYGAEERLVN